MLSLMVFADEDEESVPRSFLKYDSLLRRSSGIPDTTKMLDSITVSFISGAKASGELSADQ